ncbi:MAG: dienelactone hydrolase family protein [Candidatus Promineifilaceae bacterium]|nr:dienelactone hydrolase family protein [Candidatus Promineifilaceae bacterium]
MPIRWTHLLKRIALALLLLLLVLVLLLVGFIVGDGLLNEGPAAVANVRYPAADGSELLGYLAEPAGDGPHPAVLLIHEIWGLDDGMVVLADALAEEGYLVFAPDLFRGEGATMLPRGLWLRLTTPGQQITADADSSLAYLRDLPQADTRRIAAMGFCFGGGQSLQLGLRQPENLTTIVIYYGSLVTDPDRLRPLAQAQPVLGIFGEDDQQIGPEEVRSFEAALNELAIENEIIIYPEVGHAFLNEENYDEPGAAGAAWLQTLAFLERNLKGGGR